MLWENSAAKPNAGRNAGLRPTVERALNLPAREAPSTGKLPRLKSLAFPPLQLARLFPSAPPGAASQREPAGEQGRPALEAARAWSAAGGAATSTVPAGRSVHEVRAEPRRRLGARRQDLKARCLDKAAAGPAKSLPGTDGFRHPHFHQQSHQVPRQPPPTPPNWCQVGASR